MAGGNQTMPPTPVPAGETELIAFWIAVVSSVTPSPLAPRSFTLTMPSAAEVPAPATQVVPFQTLSVLDVPSKQNVCPTTGEVSEVQSVREKMPTPCAHAGGGGPGRNQMARSTRLPRTPASSGRQSRLIRHRH